MPSRFLPSIGGWCLRQSYQGPNEEVRRLGGQLLPFQTGENDSWDSTIGAGLRKTYHQGRGLVRQVAENPKPSNEEWHELRKRVKDLGYQLTLIKKVKGIKPLLGKLDAVGTALGDARDLTLLRDSLRNVGDNDEFDAGRTSGLSKTSGADRRTKPATAPTRVEDDRRSLPPQEQTVYGAAGKTLPPVARRITFVAGNAGYATFFRRLVSLSLAVFSDLGLVCAFWMLC